MRTRALVRDLLLDASVVFQGRPERTELDGPTDDADRHHPPGCSDKEAAPSGDDVSDRIIVSAHFDADTPVAQTGSALPRWTLDRRCYKLTADQQRVEPRYLFWALRRQLERIKPDAHRLSSRLLLSLEDLLETAVDLPGRAEQIRLARLLDGVDRLRALRDEAEVARSGLLAAMYRQSFGAEPADRWELARLGDLVEARSVPPGASDLIQHDRNVVLVWARGIRCGQVEVPRAPIERPVHAVFVRRRSPALDLLYLAETLRQADLRRLASGSVIPQLTASSLLSLRIPVPPLALQRRFASDARRANVLDEIAAEGSQRLDWLGAAVTSMAFDERPAGGDSRFRPPVGAEARRTDTILDGASLDD